MWHDEMESWAGRYGSIGTNTVVCLAQGEIEAEIAAAISGQASLDFARRCADIAELLAVSRALKIDVAVVSSRVSGFDRNLVSALTVEGVVVVAVNDPQDHYGVARLEALGVRHWVAESDVRSKLFEMVEKACAHTHKASTGHDLHQSSTSLLNGEDGQATATPNDQPSEVIGPNAPTDQSELKKRNPRGCQEEVSPTSDLHSVKLRHDLMPGGGAESTAQSPLRTHPAAGQSDMEPISAPRSRTRPRKGLGDGPQKGWFARARLGGRGGNAQTLDDSAYSLTQSEGVPARAHERHASQHAPHPLVVVVAGPHGAPGRSTIAANLACNFGPQKVLLIDADTVAPSQSQLFGMLEESSGLAFSCRAANLGALSGAEMLRLSDAINANVRLLSGLPRTERWPELTVSSLEKVLEVAREHFDVIVVDIGASFEIDELARYDQHAPTRHMAARTMLNNADVVVTVGAPDPIGLKRLISYLEELREEFGPTALMVNVMNKMDSGRRKEALSILSRFGNVEEFISVPLDRALLAAAVMRADMPTEQTRAHEYTKAITQITHRLEELRPRVHATAHLPSQAALRASQPTT